MVARPWRFTESNVECEYQAFVLDTLLDRSRMFLGIHLLFVMIPNIVVGVMTLFVLSKSDQLGMAGLAVRFVGTTTITAFYVLKWSDSWKPKIARIYFWMARFFWFVSTLMEAGILKQPDSLIKIGLLWYLYGDSVLVATFEEYLCCAFILAYLELMRLLLWGGPCPVDSSRPCTTYELWTHFAYHTLYLGVAIWIHQFTHIDRRKDFVNRRRSRRAPSSAPTPPRNPQPGVNSRQD